VKVVLRIIEKLQKTREIYTVNIYTIRSSTIDTAGNKTGCKRQKGHTALTREKINPCIFLVGRKLIKKQY